MSNPLAALLNLVLQRIWYVHEVASLTVEATPAACLQAMAIAAKPSVDRLQLREVFSDGRRYFLEPREEGFRMRCTSSVRWRYRRRTNAATMLYGTFERVGSDATRLHLRARFAIPYLLDTFLLPVLIALIIMPFEMWQGWFRLLVVALLIGLSWGAHRSHAQLQAVDMIYFIGRALEDFTPATIQALGANVPHVNDDTMHREFRQEWEKFYKERERDQAES
ncbi:MAG: hypothetical protein U0694_07685 [Anaerolineae bacterium]